MAEEGDGGSGTSGAWFDTVTGTVLERAGKMKTFNLLGVTFIHS